MSCKFQKPINKFCKQHSLIQKLAFKYRKFLFLYSYLQHSQVSTIIYRIIVIDHLIAQTHKTQKLQYTVPMMSSKSHKSIKTHLAYAVLLPPP